MNGIRLRPAMKRLMVSFLRVESGITAGWPVILASRYGLAGQIYDFLDSEDLDVFFARGLWRSSGMRIIAVK